MKELYFAPLEGITGRIYRNAHAEMFGGADAYFAPFITPTENERVSSKRLRDIVPDYNRNHRLKVQVLTTSPAAYFSFERKVASFGYDEVNFNFGCPSPTVVNKNAGAGFLRDQDNVASFLREIFASNKLKVSVKTRLGIDNPVEMEGLMEIYNQFPLSELIVHPRTLADFYRGEPHVDAFAAAYACSANPICYNGDILTVCDYEKTVSAFPELQSVMIGRGAVKNPAIFREIRGGAGLCTEELIAFSELLTARYFEEMKSEAHTLQKMKELWSYMILNYPEEKKILKRIKKAKSIQEFKEAVFALKTR